MASTKSPKTPAWTDKEKVDLEVMLREGKKTIPDIVAQFVRCGKLEKTVRPRIYAVQAEISVGFVAGAKDPSNPFAKWSDMEKAVLKKELAKFDFKDPPFDDWVKIMRTLREQTKVKRGLNSCKSQLRRMQMEDNDSVVSGGDVLGRKHEFSEQDDGSKSKRYRGGDKSSTDDVIAMVSPPDQAKNDDTLDQDDVATAEAEESTAAETQAADHATAEELAVFDKINERNKNLFLANKALRSENAKLKADVKYWYEKHQALDSLANTITSAAREEEEVKVGAGEENALIVAASQDKWSGGTSVPTNTDGPNFIPETCLCLLQIESQNSELESENAALKEEINRWKTKHDKLKELMASMASTIQKAAGK